MGIWYMFIGTIEYLIQIGFSVSLIMVNMLQAKGKTGIQMRSSRQIRNLNVILGLLILLGVIFLTALLVILF